MKRMTDLENPEKDRRVSVPLSQAHRDKIRAAMAREGIKTMADYLRFSALERARAKE